MSTNQQVKPKRLVFRVRPVAFLVLVAFMYRTLSTVSIYNRLLNRPASMEIKYDPQRVMERYIQMHSVDQLQRECPHVKQQQVNLKRHCPEISKRKFAVGFYSCPYQAGNRLHHFMNAMAWAIATNRTLLWKYYDEQACRAVGRKFAKNICFKTGTKDSCQKVLELANWIPSFDEWYPLLHLGSGAEAPYYSTHMPPTNNATMDKRHPFRKKDAHHIRIDQNDIRFLDFGQLLGQDFRILHSPFTRDSLLHTEAARNTALQLLGNGEKRKSGDYVYGMLFHAAFSFSDSLLAAVNDTILSGTENETTIALHSRHANLTDDGSQVTREVECLKVMLENEKRPCRVFVMSDRSKSIDAISSAVQDLGCIVSTVSHDKSNTSSSFSKEHGPFAGAGFFMDLAVASKAVGLVGTSRSSSMLVSELIAYESGLNGDYRFCNYEKDCSCKIVESNKNIS